MVCCKVTFSLLFGFLSAICGFDGVLAVSDDSSDSSLDECDAQLQLITGKGHSIYGLSAAWYFETGRVEGKTLLSYVLSEKEQKPQYFFDLHSVFTQFADALVYAKKQGVVIGNVALENTLIFFGNNSHPSISGLILGPRIRLMNLDQATVVDPETKRARPRQFAKSGMSQNIWRSSKN